MFLSWVNFLATSEGDALLADGSKTRDVWNTVFNIANSLVWFLVAILGIVLIVKGITTALAVVKAADEPQVRQEKIAAFKYLGIGLGIALVIATLAGTLLTIFRDDMIDKITGKLETK